MNCLAGKTMSQIVDLLTDTRDDRDGVLTWFIEQQHANGWRDVALTQTSENAAAILKLRRLIAERQQARVAKNYPELAQACEKLTKLRRASLDSQIRHPLSGRGMAAVQ